MKSTDCAVLSIKAETWYESSHRVGLALCWKAEGLNSTSAPLYLQKVVVCGHCLVTLSLTIKETLKWFELLPILMQESFWWWQCSDRYIISLFPLLQTLFPPFPVPKKPYEVMFFVDVKHHVFLLTYFNHHWRQHQSRYWWKPKIETEENDTKSKHMRYQTKSLYDELFSKKKVLKKQQHFLVCAVWFDCVKYFHYTRRLTSKHGVRSESDCQLFASIVFFSNHAIIQASTAV